MATKDTTGSEAPPVPFASVPSTDSSSTSASTPTSSSPFDKLDFSSVDFSNFDFQGIFDNFDFDISSLTENDDKIRANVFAGELGQRGEGYVAAQAVLILCVVAGGIPFVGDALMFLLGPGLMLAGATVMLLSTRDLGAKLSPWPVPIQEDEGLVTEGVFALMRHPIYAGLLASCAGLSIVTGSATRLLLTALLLYVMDVKSDYEEDELIKKYPDYTTYMDQVPGKFFPQQLLDELPWGTKE